MRIGVFNELSDLEQRVAAYPGAVRTFVEAGHEVYVMQGIGDGIHFPDPDYQAAGATVVYSAEEVYRRSEIILRVGRPPVKDLDFLDRGQIVTGFYHLRTATSSYVDALLASGGTFIGYEFIQDDEGLRPILSAISEITGQLAILEGAHHLLSSSGGRGHALGGGPGVPPCNVVIIGVSIAGLSAAYHAMAFGATVTIIDDDVSRLKKAHARFGHQVITTFANSETLPRAVQFADLLIGAARWLEYDTAPAEIFVTEEMVKTMKPFSVIVDTSLGYGGCIETSRPTNLASPTFVKHDVIHHCVTNMTSKAGRTASYAIGNALMGYVMEIGRGPEDYFKRSRDLVRGTYIRRGKVVHAGLARVFERELTPIEEA